MPPLGRRRLKQRAVLWPKTGVDPYGQPSVQDDPIEIDVRWETKRTETVDRNGGTVALDARAAVPIQVADGSKMWLGRLSEFDAAADNEVMEVVTYEEVPDVKGRDVRRVVGLRKFRSSAPETT
jgi:hypothetical protein